MGCNCLFIKNSGIGIELIAFKRVHLRLSQDVSHPRNLQEENLTASYHLQRTLKTLEAMYKHQTYLRLLFMS